MSCTSRYGWDATSYARLLTGVCHTLLRYSGTLTVVQRLNESATHAYRSLTAHVATYVQTPVSLSAAEGSSAFDDIES